MEQNSGKEDFTVFMTPLKDKVNKIDKEYKEMLSDGYIDGNELAILISRMNDLKQDSVLLRTMITNEKEQLVLDLIVDMINKESIKMIIMQNGIEEISHGFKG